MSKNLGISRGYRVQEKDGRTLIYAHDGSVFHDFGKVVEAEVYQEVIRAWQAGFTMGMKHGGEIAADEIRTTIKGALRL